MSRMPTFAVALFFIVMFGAPAAADVAQDRERCATGSNPDEKLAACSRLISSGKLEGPELPADYHIRGTGYNEKKDHYDRAMRDFDEAIRLNPKDASYYRPRGYAYYHKGDYDRAIRDFDEAIRLDPKRANP